MPAFVLVHSPRVGPLTWEPVAERLRQRGFNAVVPVLPTGGIQPLYWMQHAAAVANSLRNLSTTQSIVLVGHSGAGPFLPAARTQIHRPVAGYIFVDASLPGPDGASRFDLFESHEAVARFRGRAKHGLLPTWSELLGLKDEDLREVIPDDILREQFIVELEPLPLAVYEEPLPVFPGWPDAPCGYLQFSQVCEPSANHARKQGWPCLKLPGGHFHMLVDPEAVQEALLGLTHEMRVSNRCF